MKQRSNYIFNTIFLLALLAAPVALAQELNNEPDTAYVVADTIVAEVAAADTIPESTSFISGVGLGVDYLKLPTFFLNNETKYEGSFEIIFKNHYVVSLEAGHASYTSKRSYKNAPDYEVRGNYARLGLDYTAEFNPQTNIYIGLRYARSQFEDHGIFIISNELFNERRETIDRTGLEAAWFEVVVGSEQQMGKNFFVGGTFRLRFLNDFENFEPIPVYNIPGFGRSHDSTVPALNLFVKYRIGFF